MKPGPGDIPYRILITGRELEELKKHTWMMAEAYGLDRRIELYQKKAGQRTGEEKLQKPLILAHCHMIIISFPVHLISAPIFHQHHSCATATLPRP